MIELKMACFSTGLASSIIGILVCLEVISAHMYFRSELQDVKVEMSTKSDAEAICTCSDSSDCLPWCTCHNGLCQCDRMNKFSFLRDIIKCRNNTYSSESLLKECRCLTSDIDRNTGKVYLGGCLYSCGSLLAGDRLNNGHYLLQCNVRNTSYVCEKLGRNGRNCGYCKYGLSPYLLSYNLSCVECKTTNLNWLKFVLLAFVPLTFFYIFVLIFHINITSSRMQTVVLFSQIISVPVNCRYIYLYVAKYPRLFLLIRIIGVFHTFWNLDFFLTLFNGVCLNVSPLTAHALDYVVALYPLILILITIIVYDCKFTFLICLCKPITYLVSFVRSKADIRTSIIDSFSTFFLLSFVKILGTSFDLLTFTEIVELGSGNVTRVLYFEPSVDYFGKRHLPFGIIALILLFLFTVIPIILLTIFPCKCFQQFLSFVGINCHFLHAFVDSFQGYLKDGTEQGTCDCRWMSAYGLFIRLSLLSLFALTYSWFYYIFATIMLVCLVIVFINIDPYKKSMSYLTKNDAVFFILVAYTYVGIVGTENISGVHNTELIFCALIVSSAVMFSTFYVVVLVCRWIVTKQVTNLFSR